MEPAASARTPGLDLWTGTAARRPAWIKAASFSLVAVIALISAAGLKSSGTLAAAAGSRPVVRTSTGLVQGRNTGTQDEYLGIPYAAPPVGALRWRPPRPAAAWYGVRQAAAYAPHCPQPASAFGKASMSENCLYLNVFTPPGAAPHDLPVIVWLHGGSLLVGESDDYDPGPLVRNGVIVVTVNYRLGALTTGPGSRPVDGRPGVYTSDRRRRPNGAHRCPHTAVALARVCPLLPHGAVKVCELANHDDRFDTTGWTRSETGHDRDCARRSDHAHHGGTRGRLPYFTDPARSVQWMGSEAELEPEPGGMYRVHMSDGFKVAGTFLQVEPPDLVIFTWSCADEEAAQQALHERDEATSGNAKPPGSRWVTVMLEDEDGGTRLTLRHDDLPNPRPHARSAGERRPPRRACPRA